MAARRSQDQASMKVPFAVRNGGRAGLVFAGRCANTSGAFHQTIEKT